jgi:RsiW-degrading membrane proteinase PrsW (M82 family)
MNKNLKYSIISFALAFVEIWLCFYLISVSGLNKSNIMLVPAFLTTMLAFIGLVASGVINLFEYCCKD